MTGPSYPLIVEAARRINTSQFVIDGEAVLLGVDGISDCDGLCNGRQNHEVQLNTFDILALDGDYLRKLRLHLRKPQSRSPSGPPCGWHPSRPLRARRDWAGPVQGSLRHDAGGSRIEAQGQMVSGWPVAGLDQGQKSCLIRAKDAFGWRCSIQHHNCSDHCDGQDTCDQDKPKQRVFEDIEAVVHGDDLFI
jgi:hypothetical protein